jgi:hypothetical protein
MAEVWISVHDAYPVYALDGPPPSGLRLSNRQVAVSERTAAAWQEALQRYRQAQDEMAQAYFEAAAQP